MTVNDMGGEIHSRPWWQDPDNDDKHIGNLEGGWTIERGVTCVVCPDCAFTFDAGHWNSGNDNRYSCPLCDPKVAP